MPALYLIHDQAPEVADSGAFSAGSMTGRTDPDPHGTLMSTPDPELDRIRRAFDAAFQRMRVASTVGDHEDELSNLLQHLYKLGELVRKRRGLTRDGLEQFLHDSADPDLRAGGAAMWARTFDTHDTMVVVLVGDLYTDNYGEMLASWKSLTQTDNFGRHDDYAELLKDHPVLDTIRRAFDAMAALLQKQPKSRT